MELELEIPKKYGGTVKNSYAIGPKPKSRSKKITHLQDEIEIDAYGSPVEIGQRLIDAAKGLEDATVRLKTKHEYGEEETVLIVFGWRPMTDHELTCYQEQLAAYDAQRVEWERREFERVKKNHPDWVKDDLL